MKVCDNPEELPAVHKRTPVEADLHCFQKSHSEDLAAFFWHHYMAISPCLLSDLRLEEAFARMDHLDSVHQVVDLDFQRWNLKEMGRKIRRKACVVEMVWEPCVGSLHHFRHLAKVLFVPMCLD